MVCCVQQWVGNPLKPYRGEDSFKHVFVQLNDPDLSPEADTLEQLPTDGLVMLPYCITPLREPVRPVLPFLPPRWWT